MKFGSVIYICNFFLKKYLYTTPQLFLEECSSYTLLYSLLQYFHQFFSITLLQITPKNISSYYTYITPQFVHTYTLSYILPTLYIRKKRKKY